MMRPSLQSGSIRLRGGFTFVELLIILMILGVLAALVVPTFSTAAASAREANLIDNLRHIRTQLLVYAAEHDGVPPGHPGGNVHVAPTYEAFVAQMTTYTDGLGNASPTRSDGYSFGPYLRQIPANPFNGAQTIRFFGPTESLPPSPTGSEGWFYQPSTLTFVANATGQDASGRAYFDY